MSAPWNDARTACFDALPLAVVVLERGAVLYANPELRRLAALPPETDLVGQALGTLFHPEERPALEARFETLHHGGPALDWSRCHLLRPDGTPSPAALKASLLEGSEGRPVVVAYLRDLSEQATLEQRLGWAEEGAAIAGALDGVAHGLAGPLTLVSSNLELLGQELTRAAASSDSIQLLGDARGGVERLREAVRDLRRLAGREESPLAGCDIHDALGIAMRVAAPALRRRVAVRIDIAPGLPHALARRSRLEQTLLALLVECGQRVQRIPGGDPSLHVSAAFRDGWVELELQQGGEPQPEAPPLQLTPTLAMCRDRLREMGGLLELEPGARGGQRLRLRLPPAPEAPPPPRPTSSPSLPPPVQG